MSYLFHFYVILEIANIRGEHLIMAAWSGEYGKSGREQQRRSALPWITWTVSSWRWHMLIFSIIKYIYIVITIASYIIKLFWLPSITFQIKKTSCFFQISTCEVWCIKNSKYFSTISNTKKDISNISHFALLMNAIFKIKVTCAEV